MSKYCPIEKERVAYFHCQDCNENKRDGCKTRKTRLYKLKTTFFGADGPIQFYFADKELAEHEMEGLPNGEIEEVEITSVSPLNYSDGCTFAELTRGMEIWAKERRTDE